MVKVVSGTDRKGRPIEIYVDGYMKKALDIAKIRVKGKSWDYLAIIAGLCGVGKSTLARTIARYCCSWFDEKYIAFTAEQFIKITNECKEYSAVVLDESFASLNTRVTNSKDFLRIVNHLQIIRSKHLFIILCLPNFFDLSKGIAIFRSNHLFVPYADEMGNRTSFLAFDRVGKRKLYVRGYKFLDYNAQKANFIGAFTKNENIVPEKIYDRLKLKHLMSQQDEIEKISKNLNRDVEIYKLNKEEGWKTSKIAKFKNLGLRRVQEIIQNIAKNAK